MRKLMGVLFLGLLVALAACAPTTSSTQAMPTAAAEQVEAATEESTGVANPTSTTEVAEEPAPTELAAEEPTVAVAQELPEGIWRVHPGGDTDSPEYDYPGPTSDIEPCVRITLQANVLPKSFEPYIQVGYDRYAFDIVSKITSQDSHTVVVSLSDFLLKDGESGKLDEAMSYSGDLIDYAGIRIDDRTRRFDFVMNEFTFDCTPE